VLAISVAADASSASSVCDELRARCASRFCACTCDAGSAACALTRGERQDGDSDSSCRRSTHRDSLRRLVVQVFHFVQDARDGAGRELLRSLRAQKERGERSVRHTPDDGRDRAPTRSWCLQHTVFISTRALSRLAPRLLAKAHHVGLVGHFRKTKRPPENSALRTETSAAASTRPSQHSLTLQRVVKRFEKSSCIPATSLLINGSSPLSLSEVVRDAAGARHGDQYPSVCPRAPAHRGKGAEVYHANLQRRSSPGRQSVPVRRRVRRDVQPGGRVRRSGQADCRRSAGGCQRQRARLRPGASVASRARAPFVPFSSARVRVPCSRIPASPSLTFLATHCAPCVSQSL